VAKRKDDAVLEVGAILAGLGAAVLIALFDGWPSYVLAALLLSSGLYLILAVWFEWPRPGRAPSDDQSPRLGPPPSPRTGIRMQGGTGNFSNARIRNQDVSIDTKDTDLKLEGPDIE
jgi:hypothetical protein